MATLPQRWLTGTPARRLGGSLLALIFVLSFFALILDGHHYSSPFEVDPALWADGGPQPVPVTPTFPVGPSPKRWGMKVSNVVHYVMLARPDGSTEMDYRQYLAIRSALVVQRPAAIYLRAIIHDFKARNRSLIDQSL